MTLDSTARREAARRVERSVQTSRLRTRRDSFAPIVRPFAWPAAPASAVESIVSVPCVFVVCFNSRPRSSTQDRVRFRSAHDDVVYRVVAALLVTAALYVLHQDLWFWREARPLVFGFLPIGLFYHAAYTIAASGLLWMLVRLHWPAHLEDHSHE